MKDVRQEILAVLKEVRDANPRTRKEEADRLGLRSSSVHVFIRRLYEGDEGSHPKIEQIVRFAESLDVDIILTARLILPDGTEQTVSGVIEHHD